MFSFWYGKGAHRFIFLHFLRLQLQDHLRKSKQQALLGIFKLKLHFTFLQIKSYAPNINFKELKNCDGKVKEETA